MDRVLLIEWMDAVAPLWKGADYESQRFIDRWWWDLFECLKDECLEFCPGEFWKKAH